MYQARCAAIDKAKIASIKASVDATSPPRFKHVTVNAKKLQMEENRLVEIEKRNMHLLDNLSRISARQSGLRGSNTGGPSSWDATDGVSKVTRKPKVLRLFAGRASELNQQQEITLTFKSKCENQ